MKGFEMHTTESKWQDEPIELAGILGYHANKISTPESMGLLLMRADATIRALVELLEKERAANLMEPQE